MAKIKLNNLTNEQKPEMIDLKAEAEKGNSDAITAFKSLRGGAAAGWCCCCKWASSAEMMM